MKRWIFLKKIIYRFQEIRIKNAEKGIFSNKLRLENYNFESNERLDEQPAELPDEQPDNTNIPDLEKEELAAQRINQTTTQLARGIKILTPNPTLSQIPITLAQIQAGNNPQKRKNQIRKLFCFCYRSKEITKKVYKSFIEKVYKLETIFTNTRNSKTNGAHRFKPHQLIKLIVKIILKILLQ